MKIRFYAAASALTLALTSVPAAAQHAGHSGTMPMPAKPEAKKKPAAKKPAAKKATAKKPAAKKAVAKQRPTPAKVSPPAHDHSKTTGIEAPVASPEPAPVDHSEMSHTAPAQGTHEGHESHSGAFGSYPMTREASGTSWQPDTSEHMGAMRETGDWTLMGHGVLNLIFDTQSGRRGDDKTFVSGMLMGMARRPLGDGTLQLKAMVSPDPLMGKSGYPLLLASGETANGVDRLIDRQHPHDFFVELSASVSQAIGTKSSLFLYGGLPGEPAFGPPAFMHREAILDSPEAPISHHWLDSTHISFGVLTAGIVVDRFKIEVSRFNGREPDEHRWNIETAPFDSTAVRISWNPTQTLSVQGSWGHFVDPEQLEPGVDQRRWSASLLYANEIAPGWKLAGTIAWGRKSADGHDDDAFVAESSLKNGPWTVFSRAEVTENRELLDLEEEEHGPAFTVGKVSLGAVRDFKIADHLALGVGGLVAVNFVPDGLFPEYGGSNPFGAMGFLRLKLG